MAAGFRKIARVVKAHGSRGEVVALAVDGLPPLLSRGLEVCVVPPALTGLRWRVVERAGEATPGQLVALSGVRDLAHARELAGRYLLVREGDLPEGLAAHDPARLIGREVADARLGLIGTIEEVMQGPANDVWVVRGGAFGEVLVPVVDEVVRPVAPTEPIDVDLPDGLVREGQ